MLKRLTKDLKELQQNELNDIYNPMEGIYIHINDENITQFTCMINGLKDTPYEYGNFFISLKIPSNYPFVPPEVKFLSTNGIIRFHPFLYQNGKICLSILNTWSGPTWTSVQTIKSVLLSIQSIFNNTPLNDEPGHGEDHELLVQSYSRIVEYYKYDYSIIHQLTNNPFPQFYKVQQKLFNENFDLMLQNIKDIQIDLKKELPVFSKKVQSIVSLKFSYDKQNWSLSNFDLSTPQNSLYTEIFSKCDFGLFNEIQDIEITKNSQNKLVYINILSIKIYSPNPFKMDCKFQYNDIVKKLKYLKEKL